MDAASGGKIVTRRACGAYGMPSFRVHQTNDPEIEAEGRTPAEASDRLVPLLVQSTDFAGEAWR
jgi:hypothetical protein